LRSRCNLVCDGTTPLELVHANGRVDELELDRSGAQRLYIDAYSTARDAGFLLMREPIRLMPQPKLVEIVRRSQERALAGEGGDAGEPT